MVVIIDYGMGNVGSIRNMLKRIGCDAIISSSEDDLSNASHLVLPGVGAFDAGIAGLHEMRLRPLLDELVLGRCVPILGVCLGMQLLTKKSEEGMSAGLGWIDAETVRFRFDENSENRIPHMGWNDVEPRVGATLFDGETQVPRYYFVHSYHLMCADRSDVSATATYGYTFTASVQRGNVFGVQFHPEKSHLFGMRVFERFVQFRNCVA